MGAKEQVHNYWCLWHTARERETESCDDANPPAECKLFFIIKHWFCTELRTEDCVFLHQMQVTRSVNEWNQMLIHRGCHPPPFHEHLLPTLALFLETRSFFLHIPWFLHHQPRFLLPEFGLCSNFLAVRFRPAFLLYLPFLWGLWFYNKQSEWLLLLLKHSSVLVLVFFCDLCFIGLGFLFFMLVDCLLYILLHYPAISEFYSGFAQFVSM